MQRNITKSFKHKQNSKEMHAVKEMDRGLFLIIFIKKCK